MIDTFLNSVYLCTEFRKNKYLLPQKHVWEAIYISIFSLDEPPLLQKPLCTGKDNRYRKNNR